MDDVTAPEAGRRGLKNQQGDDRFRLGMSKLGKRAEEAAMIS
jgi:hypothetical protein